MRSTWELEVSDRWVRGVDGFVLLSLLLFLAFDRRSSLTLQLAGMDPVKLFRILASSSRVGMQMMYRTPAITHLYCCYHYIASNESVSPLPGDSCLLMTTVIGIYNTRNNYE